MREHSETEVFSNPLPPEAHGHHHQSGHDDDEHPLTNDDFRKLLMTPGGPTVKSAQSAKTSENSESRTHHETSQSAGPNETEEDDAATRRRKKKSYYAKLKKIEDERQKELDQKYRDRARERRDGANTELGTGEVSTTADYRAVAPDVKIGESYAERRKQIIQESKYLGGDMEHTHLVKGLDFALLEKVRAEITSKEVHDDQIEQYLTQAAQQPQQKKQEKDEDPENLIEFRTKLARNVYRVACKPRPNERNELFLPGRMAYVVDLEDEYAESDIPTTLIRSKADCVSAESTTIMSTNDIVISKLTQILTYLRQGKRDRKKLKKDKGKKEEEKSRGNLHGADDGIYPEVRDIYPMLPPSSKDVRVKREVREERPSSSSRDRRDRDSARREDRGQREDRGHDRRDRERGRGQVDRGQRDRRDRGGERDERKRKSYFEKPAEEDEVKDAQRPQNARDLVKSINDKFSQGWGGEDARREDRKPAKKEEERMKKIKKRMEIDSYAECYPGMEESADAVIDSDEEADYTKMDMGNKKGPVGRWDFENQEEYSNYMSSKEALPKAAFQYGVKMADGRKTRRAGPKDEKAQLDRQWQKIQNIIQKRKGAPEEGRGGKHPRQ